MAIVTASPTPLRQRAKRATDPYSIILRDRPRPAFDLGGLAADLADATGTGIDFLDQNVQAIRKQVEDAALAAKITALCSIAAGLASVLLLFRTARK